MLVPSVSFICARGLQYGTPIEVLLPSMILQPWKILRVSPPRRSGRTCGGASVVESLAGTVVVWIARQASWTGINALIPQHATSVLDVVGSLPVCSSTKKLRKRHVALSVNRLIWSLVEFVTIGWSSVLACTKKRGNVGIFIFVL